MSQIEATDGSLVTGNCPCLDLYRVSPDSLSSQVSTYLPVLSCKPIVRPSRKLFVLNKDNGIRKHFPILGATKLAISYSEEAQHEEIIAVEEQAIIIAKTVLDKKQ